MRLASSRILVALLGACLTSTLFAYPANIENQSFSAIIKEHASLSVIHLNFEETRRKLWFKYLNDVQGLSALKAEYKNRALKYGDKTMRFSLDKIGDAPAEGYPMYIALHGGGSGPSSMNDSQWYAMQSYYRSSVKNGVYVAPRGITDTWKLHSEDESYPLYDKLIEAAVLFDNVDPNRVYFLGFSAGGDGVYQVVPRMPSRFAAANMSAGHHNWIKFDNLYNTPMLLQVGENDGAYERNKVSVKNYIILNELHAAYGAGFIHDLYMHYNGSHNSWQDNDPARRDHTIIAYPIAWLNNGNRATKTVNSNAIDWMSQYKRQAVPTKLVWDLSVAATSRGYQSGADLLAHDGDTTTKLAHASSLFYWLDVSIASHYPENGKLVVEADKATNMINVIEATNVDAFKILLNPMLVDLDVPVKIAVQGKQIGTVSVTQDLSVMVRTLLERSDINEIYDAEVTLSFNQGLQVWEIQNDK